MQIVPYILRMVREGRVLGEKTIILHMKMLFVLPYCFIKPIRQVIEQIVILYVIKCAQSCDVKRIKYIFGLNIYLDHVRGDVKRIKCAQMVT